MSKKLFQEKYKWLLLFNVILYTVFKQHDDNCGTNERLFDLVSGICCIYTGYRCCPHGCNKRCAAVTVDGKHPGSCGAAYGKRGKTCKVDSSCEGHEKCCYGKCREVRKQIVKVLYPIKS
ncbi:perlwapin-like protein isoform X2 [Mytilus edulis]|uniref:perlwapin-like protein isoform X2 n=1 Tax=Mytilus edulis TaxID=6550 RepID=UPI0039EE5F17